jgi:hypothetical protein
MVMVELPPDEVHLKIGTLSLAAKKLLRAYPMENMHTIETFLVEEAEELVKAGMLEPQGADESLPQLFTPTWQGGLASAKLRSGIYEHHERLYEERAARDAMLEAIPGFASF